jgi:O-antigen ligase
MSPWYLIALAIAIGPFAQRLSELCFMAALGVAVYAAPWQRLDWGALVRRLVWPVAVTAWLVLRVKAPWGLGFHTLHNPLRFPVTFLDYAPFLWALIILERQALRSREAKALTYSVAATAPVWVLLSLVQVRLPEGGSLSGQWFGVRLIQADLPPFLQGRVSSGFGQWGCLGLMMLFTCVALWIAFWASGRRLRAMAPSPGKRSLLAAAVLGLLLGASLGVLVLSGSRSAWSAAPFLLLSWAFLARARVRALYVLLPTLVVSALLLFSIRDLGPPSRLARAIVPEIVSTRLAAKPEARYRTTPTTWRLAVWRCASDLIREKPLTGWGIGAFAPECEARDHQTRNHAHNAFLQLASELGLPFAMGVAAWMLWLVIVAGRRLVAEEASEARLYRVGFFLIVVATVVASQTELALLHDTRLEIIFWTALAALRAPLCARV